ncbi:lanthionine synthetase LanC family protein [Amycolatopsis rubida]|uniref:Lanthionine synthetase C-like protein n=1 Tax=Amycolatopsis rubida TaxID=112413 RepID=A0A1I5X7T2_9PSEU|nr:lanthionine synthetase LanC family protein [Amycolatopsis rubida]SFQ27707.1 Lanthionine synthetase C-like protein [Amycolatopsis rubida]
MKGLGCPGPGRERNTPPHPLTLLDADSPLTTAMYVAVRAGQTRGFPESLPAALDALPPVSLFDVPGAGETGFCGAAALASVLRIASINAPHLAEAYRHRLAAADARLDGIVHTRLDAARRRLHDGARPARAEFSLRQGLSGLGMCLLQRPGPDPLLPAVLEYLVDLVVNFGDTERPGWWVDDSPHPDLREREEWRHGHADLTLPDGSGGILALLSLAWRARVRVPAMDTAIRTLAEWYRRHLRADEIGNPWWPDVVGDPDPAAEPDAGVRRPSQLVPGWCGGLGIDRSVQLAGMALGDAGLRETAVAAAGAALHWDADEIRQGGLCHGPQGAQWLALRMAADESDDAACSLRSAAGVLRSVVRPHAARTASGGGFLDGALGVLVSQSPNETSVDLPSADAAQWDCVLGLTAIRVSSRTESSRRPFGQSPQAPPSRTDASTRAAPSG